MKILKISPAIALIFLWVQIMGSFQLAFAQQGTSKKIAVAVADLDGTGLSEQERAVLSDRLRAEIWKTQKFDVLERQKMDAILQEQGFQLTGACDDASCLLEIGRLLPVERIIGGSVGKIGNTWTVTLRMINIGSGRIERTVIKDCRNCTIDEILNPHLSYAAADMAEVEAEYAEADQTTHALPDMAEQSRVRLDQQPDKTGDFGKGAKMTTGAAKKGGGSIFGKWWFWAVVAGAGGGAAAALSSSSGDKENPGSDTGSIIIEW